MNGQLTPDEIRRRKAARRRREQQRRRRRRARIIALLFVLIIIIIVCACVNAAKRRSEARLQAEIAAITPSPEPSPSPRPTPNIPPVEEENDLLKIAANPQGTEEHKYCYLTFDDGPTESITPQILDILAEYDIHATFFEVGSLIESNRDIAERVYEEGHFIANHSYKHSYGSLYADSDGFLKEVNDTQDLIEDVTEGTQQIKVFRFPGGSYNTGTYGAVKQTYKKVLQDNGYYYCDWNTLIGDADTESKTKTELVNAIKENAKYNNIVVLMHDASSKQTTADALPEILDYLIDEGYEFRRLDEITYYVDGYVPEETTEPDVDETASPEATPTPNRSTATAAPSATQKSSSSSSATSKPSATQKSLSSSSSSSRATTKPSATQSSSSSSSGSSSSSSSSSSDSSESSSSSSESSSQSQASPTKVPSSSRE